jgi:hypothetical protein
MMGIGILAQWEQRCDRFNRPAVEGAITGDFVALSSELNPLITALRDNGIELTAIHNHMVGEEPRAFFVHFWANDDAIKLAHGLGVALKTVAVVEQ